MLIQQPGGQALKLLLTASAVLTSSCGGGGDAGQSAGEETSASPPPQVTTRAGGTPAGGASPSVALGDSIFHGLAAGGTCYTCHGAGAKGTQLAPDLTDAAWLHGDGSEQFLVQIITNGVMTPKQHSSVMPPKGGAPLSDEQVRAVAMYVKSIGSGS